MSALRPIYFVVVVWGDRFVDHFLTYLVSSMLAPGNLPALELGRENKFLICCPDADWQRIRAHPSFDHLEKLVMPVHVEIGYPPAGRSGCEHMGAGHIAATEMAFRDKAFGCMLTPDMVISDGSLGTLQRLMRDGQQLVLATSMRAESEGFLRDLHREIGGGSGEAPPAPHEPLCISGRRLSALSLANLHSEAKSWEFESGYFGREAVGCWFAHESQPGVSLFALSWAPVLLDYGALDLHDTAMLETRTLDADYLNRNVRDWSSAHVIQDTDDFAMVSWAPAEDRPLPLRPDGVRASPFFGEAVRGLILRERFFSPIFDDFKRYLFTTPVRMHTEDLGADWFAREERARATVAAFTKRREETGAATLVRWRLMSLLAHVFSWEGPAAVVLWIGLRLYRPRANRDVTYGFVLDNLGDLLARARRRLGV